MAETVVPRERLGRLERHRALKTHVPYSRALITGVSGYLGHALALALLSQGIVQEIVAPVRTVESSMTLWRNDPLASRLQWVHWDLTQPFPDLEGVELIILTAAGRPDSTSVMNCGFVANISGTLNAVLAARQARVSRLIFVSSQSVYGATQPLPCTEDSATAPESAYGHSKVAGEAVVQTLGGSVTHWAILRMARLYGLSPNMRWHELPHRFASRAAMGETLPIHGDGKQLVDLIHVRDAVGSIINLTRKPASEWNQTYNVGSGSLISVRALAEACVSLSVEMGLPCSSMTFIPEASPGPSFGMDTSKAQRRLHWIPGVSLPAGLTELIEYVRKERVQPMRLQTS
jgi:UDP-glucose 4-epimerase